MCILYLLQPFTHSCSKFCSQLLICFLFKNPQTNGSVVCFQGKVISSRLAHTHVTLRRVFKLILAWWHSWQIKSLPFGNPWCVANQRLISKHQFENLPEIAISAIAVKFIIPDSIFLWCKPFGTWIYIVIVQPLWRFFEAVVCLRLVVICFLMVRCRR